MCPFPGKAGEGALRPFPHLRWGKVGMGARIRQRVRYPATNFIATPFMQ